MRVRYFLILFFCIPLFSVAQYDSRLGRFQVDEKMGCAPFTVNIHHVLPGHCFDGGLACAISWGDGTPAQQDSTYTYTQPGTYTITITYTSPLGTDDIEVTVTPNTQPDFDIITCGNREVEVRVTDTNYDSYFINFNDGTEEEVPSGNLAFANHPYAAAGAQTISVRGNNIDAADNCTPLTKPVNVLDVLPPPFIDALTVASTSQIDLAFTALPNILYRLEIAVNTGSFQTLQTLYNVSTATVTNLTPDNNYYCFRLGAFDPCNNIIVYSNTICSANFDATPVNNAVNLAWTTSTSGVTNFTINRDGSSIGSPGGLTFTDNNVECTIDYSYQLITNYTNGSQSTSLSKSATAFSNDVPTAVEDVSAVVGNGSVEMTWLQDPAFQTTQYRIYRKSGSGNFSLLDNAAITQFTDPAYSTNDEYCYRIDYVDNCGNSSLPGIEVCPIRLSGSVNSENEIRLDWSAYTGWQNGVNEYIVEKYDAEGVPLQVFNVGTNLFYEDAVVDVTNQQYVYVVVANANDAGLGQAISNEITITKNPNIFYPTAFTPDGLGDIRNEVFKVFGQFVETFEMNIFNRWGELLFTTTDINQGWDGNFRGKPQPEGTYAFSATLTDFEGRTFKRSGSFVLLRKK